MAVLPLARVEKLIRKAGAERVNKTFFILLILGLLF